jgi:retinoid hydroxylase
VAVAPPAPRPQNPLTRLVADLNTERVVRKRPVPLPPGEYAFSMVRTRRFETEPLQLLLEFRERYGDVFGMRILYATVVFMLGPEANHFMTVSGASKFEWRTGGMGDLIPLLGDGLLTIDGAYHKRSRRIMLPAFHRDRIAAAGDTMLEETRAAMERWRPGEPVDLYHWTRELALRIAQRALFGFDPDRRAGDLDAAEAFERALGFWGRAYLLQIIRGPRTPWRRMAHAREQLDGVIFEEIRRRRGAGPKNGAGPPMASHEAMGPPASSRVDLLSLLLQAQDEDGSVLSDREVRDQVMTLMFAGHDTTTSTVTFLFYELARAQHVLARLLAEQDEVLGGRPVEAADLVEGRFPELELAIAETLRLYPPAWIGPRRNIEDIEFGGTTIPAGLPVNYCSWASHHLPDVFPEPEAFIPERFTPENRAALPKGAYVPFGGGSRTCIGMRFGEMEIRAIAATVLQRFRLELQPAYQLSIRQMPTLSPRQGMPMRIRARDAAPVAA